MNTYYDILGISNDATDTEIINAYYTLIKKNTEEKNKQKHSLIVKAYNVLMDEKRRLDYDISLTYIEKITPYEIRAKNNLKNNNYKEAIKEYDIILSMYKHSPIHLYRLIKILYKDNQLNRAINECENLVKLCPDNKNYTELMAFLYKQNKDYDKSIEFYVNTYEISLEEKIALEVVNIYKILEKNEEVIVFLQQCIQKNKLDVIENINYYKEIIKIYTKDNNNSSIKYIIYNIKNIIINNSLKKEEYLIHFCEHLYELSKTFYSDGIIESSYTILRQIKIVLEDIDLHRYLKVYDKVKLYENTSDLCSEINNRLNLDNEYKTLEKDNDITSNIKLIAKNSLLKNNFNTGNEELINSDLKESIDKLHRDLEISPNEIMKNLKLFKSRYKLLFDCEQKTYTRFLNHSMDLDNFEVQYAEFKENIDNDYNIKKIIELILTDSLNNNERVIGINICLRNIMNYDYDKKEHICNFIIIIEEKYPKVYELYSRGYNKLIEDLKPSKYEYIKNKIKKFIFTPK